MTSVDIFRLRIIFAVVGVLGDVFQPLTTKMSCHLKKEQLSFGGELFMLDHYLLFFFSHEFNCCIFFFRPHFTVVYVIKCSNTKMGLNDTQQCVEASVLSSAVSATKVRVNVFNIQLS